MSVKKTINNDYSVAYSADTDSQYVRTVDTDTPYAVQVRRSSSLAASSDKTGYAVAARRVVVGTAQRTVVAYSAPYANLTESDEGCVYILSSSAERSLGSNGSTLNRFGSNIGSNPATRLSASYLEEPGNKLQSRKIGSGDHHWTASGNSSYRYRGIDINIIQKGSTYYKTTLAGSTNHWSSARGARIGAAYVWDLELDVGNTKFVQEYFLTASDTVAGDGFGAEVLSNTNAYGNYVFVGAPGQHSGSTADAGAIYYYRWNNSGENYAELGKLTTPYGSQTNAYHGTALSAYDLHLVAGAPGHDHVAIYTQTAAGAFTKVQTINHPSASTSGNTKFGISVSLSSSYLAVGATLDSGSEGKVHSDAAGRVFIYKSSSAGFALEAEVAPTASHADNQNSWFGISVSMDGGYLVVGNSEFRAHPNALKTPGRVYIYKSGSGGWSEHKVIDYPGTNQFVYMGASIANANGMAVVGAHGDHATLDDSGTATGVAYIYDESRVTSTANAGQPFRYGAKTVNNIRGIGAGTDIKITTS